MGKRFITEREIEDDLIDESRALTMLDGTVHHVRRFRLAWRNYDIVVTHGPLSPAEINTLAKVRAQKDGVGLDEALADVLAPLRTHVKRCIDDKIAVLNRKLGRPKKNS